jgi:hypothetical protein
MRVDQEAVRIQEFAEGPRPFRALYEHWERHDRDRGARTEGGDGSAERDEVAAGRRRHGDDARQALDVVRGRSVVPDEGVRMSGRDGSGRVAAVGGEHEAAAAGEKLAVHPGRARGPARVVLDEKANGRPARPELESRAHLRPFERVAAGYRHNRPYHALRPPLTTARGDHPASPCEVRRQADATKGRPPTPSVHGAVLEDADGVSSSPLAARSSSLLGFDCYLLAEEADQTHALGL